MEDRHQLVARLCYLAKHQPSTHRLGQRRVAPVEGAEREQDVATDDQYRERHCRRQRAVVIPAARAVAPTLQLNPRRRDVLGKAPFQANVTASVVMSSLSAAGSRIVPRTDVPLKLRAR